MKFLQLLGEIDRRPDSDPAFFVNSVDKSGTTASIVRVWTRLVIKASEYDPISLF
jgi:hypothetical protein